MIWLSELPIAKIWLNQFSEVDQEFARLLIDSLMFVSQETLVREIQALIENIVEIVDSPIALIPVKEVAKDQSYFGHSSNKNAKPKLLNDNSFPGSEAIVAQLAGRMRRSAGKQGAFVASPSLKNIRQSGCRSIFFLEDYIGSGSRMCKFLDSVEKHKTIKSWYSYGLIRFHVIAYSATESGIREIMARKRKPKIHYARKGPTFEDANWTTRQKQAIEDICLRYSPYGEENAFGYGETKGLLVFEHSVPNNLPSILWGGNGRWRPLFLGRTVPQELLPVFMPSSLEEIIEKTLERLGQQRLSRGDWAKQADVFEKKIILVLSATIKSKSDLIRISESAQLSISDTEKILTSCYSHGLVDDTRRLTDRGMSLLEHARRMLADNKSSFATKREFYYPVSLRKA